MPAPDIYADAAATMSESQQLLVSQLRARIGTMIRNKWRIDALLGVGGMAAVYACTHRNGHRCAIKMLLPSYATNGDIIKRFLKEGYVANDVRHPGAVTVLDDDATEDGSYFLVMELLEGESFERVIRKHDRGIDAIEALRVTHDVLAVLAAAHARHIVHRDIKPDNVFLLKDGRVKVLDFGIARVKQSQTGSGGTQHGTVLGTPGFMPPEQARGHLDAVDAQSDLWAVGAMMFVALTGRPLRLALTTNEELLQAMTEPPPPLRTVAPNVPQAVSDIVDRALLFDKPSRWRDAREMQAAVRAALGDDAATLHNTHVEEEMMGPTLHPTPEARRGTELVATRSESPPVPAATRSAARPPSKMRRALIVVLAATAMLVTMIVVRATHSTTNASPANGGAVQVGTAPDLPPLVVASASAGATSIPMRSSIPIPIPIPVPTSTSTSSGVATPKQAGKSAPVKAIVAAKASASATPPVPTFDPLNRRL
jgi:serine/threonine protein kinase